MCHMSAQGIDEHMINVHYYLKKLWVHFLCSLNILFAILTHQADRYAELLRYLGLWMFSADCSFSSPGAVACDFSRDFCGWRQDQSDNFDWQRHAHGTPSSQTGPSGDHTTGCQCSSPSSSLSSSSSKSSLSSLCLFLPPCRICQFCHSLTFFLSFLFGSLPLCLWLCPSLSACLSLSICLPVCVCPSVCLSVSLSLTQHKTPPTKDLLGLAFVSQRVQ